MFEFITKRGKQFFVNGWIAGIDSNSDELEVKQIQLVNELIPRKKFKDLLKGGDRAKDALIHFTNDEFFTIAIHAKIQDAWTGEMKKELKLMVKDFMDYAISHLD